MIKNLLSAFALLCAGFASYSTNAEAQTETVYRIDFSESQDGWTSVKQNTSGKEWVARTKTQGYYESGQYLDCVGLSSTFVPATDAWYVSPSVTLKAGYTYEVSTFAAQKNNVALTLNIGTSTTDMTTYTQVDELSPIPTNYDTDGIITKEVTVDKDGEYRFALRATTSDNYAPYDCYLFGFEVAQKGGGSTPDPDATAIPYVVNFTESVDGWTNYNYNEDGETWLFFSGMGAGMASQLADADDSFVSPKFYLQKGKRYKVLMNVQMFNTPSEKYHLAMAAGTSMDKDDLKALKQINLEQQGYNVDSLVYTPAESGTYYFAFVNTTEADITNGAVILSAFGIREYLGEDESTEGTVFSDDFTAADRMGQWTVSDANTDGTTWAVVDGVDGITYDSDIAGTKFPADDWLFSPAFNTKDGQDYLVTYTVKRQGAFDPDLLEVHFGNAATAAGMTKKLTTDEIDANAETITRTVRLSCTSTGASHLGFHMVSPYSDNGQFSLTSVTVTAAEKTTPEKVENFNATASKKENTVTLTWTNPTFDTKGVALNEPLTVRLYDEENEIASVENQEAGKNGSYTFTPSASTGYATYRAVALIGSKESEPVSVTINLDDVQGDSVLVRAFDVDYDKAGDWKIQGACRAWKYDYQDVFTYNYRQGTKYCSEWLLSPVVRMYPNVRYVVTYELKTSQDYGNNVEITLGSAQDSTAQTRVIASYPGLRQNGFATYKTAQFNVSEDASYSIGFHVTNSNYYVNVRNLRVYFIQDGNVNVGINGVNAEGVAGETTVYDTMGRRVAKHENATIENALQALPKGIYIVRTTDADGNSSTRKIMK